MTHGDAFVARYSPVRSILLGLLSLGFVAIGLWMIGAFGEAPSGSRRLSDGLVPYLGWLSILFFGPIALLHVVRTFVPGTAVRVDAAGIMIPAFGKETVPWDDFTELASWNMMGTQMLLFDVVEERLASLSTLKRMLWKANESFSGLGGSLVINNTNRKHRELVEAVLHFAPPRLTQWL